MLFHHTSGSCYVVDCGSAHGTFVNGVRVQSTQNRKGSSTIKPHRVKKGAIIRFGGPGAPSFILKSFSVGLKFLLSNVEEMKKIDVCKDVSNTTSVETCLNEMKSTSSLTDTIVALNTRINAIGRPDKFRLPKRNNSHHETQSSNVLFPKRRSIVSFDETDVQTHLRPQKRLKTAFDDINLSTKLTDHPLESAVVSPTKQNPTIIFHFDDIDRPVVSPTLIEEHQIPLLLQYGSCNTVKGILVAPLMIPSTSKKIRRVVFSEEIVKIFYPPSITLPSLIVKVNQSDFEKVVMNQTS